MLSNIAIVTGGDSGEYEISLKSAEVVMEHIDRDMFRPWKVLITGSRWVVEDDGASYLIDKNDFTCVVKGERIRFSGAFLILHGTPGEDGKLQGYFDMIGMPYTGCNVATSAVTFHKGYCTAVARAYGFTVANSVLLTTNAMRTPEELVAEVGLPCFVKPNNAGSSIGISRVNTLEDMAPALAKAFEVDTEVLAEAFVAGTEVTCGVANYNGKPEALAVTEIVFETEFFDYHAKYSDPATQEITPARIPEEEYKEVMRMSEDLYRLLNCKGMVRIDFIIQDGVPHMIEVNTIPGLTAMSLVPKQAEYRGTSKKELFTGIMLQALSR